MNIKRIAIVGGGTAGWLAANHLGAALSANKDVSITLIESPDVPTIGVGEGTVPAIRDSLKKFGIRETDFIRECDATFKHGIKFINWLDKYKHGENNYYYHPFDYPFPFGDDLAPYWLHSKAETHYADVVSAQARLCEAGLAPKKISTPEYQGEATYAYHLNATKFAKLLSKHAASKFSVQHLFANVTNIKCSDDGYITALVTKELGELEFDFYIDATGFASYILGEKLNIPFIDKSDQLFIDSALVVQVPTEENTDIPPYTLSTAHQAGWIWDIALPERRGVGFVYSSKHLGENEARQKFSKYLKEPGNGLSFKKIPMKVGHRSVFWHKNCVAIGLSQGFVEPLEATAILQADYAAKMLSEQFPRVKKDIDSLAQRYNRALTYSWERVCDFIKMHYCISNRSDSDFWTDNRRPETMSEHLGQQLEHWRRFSPKAQDFFSKFEVFDVENFLYVLYGMNFPTTKPALSAGYQERAKAQIKQLHQHSQHLMNELPRHRSLIEKIQKYGLQNI